ncbi:MAG: N-acetylmuramoyl-L-alanine amidase, partial [Opitutus sp.]
MFAAVLQAGNEPLLRVAPTRPGTSLPAPTVAAASPAPAASGLPRRKFGGVDYVGVAEAARRLGLQLSWIVRGQKLTLTGPGVKVVMESEARETQANGLRVFLGEPVRAASGQLFVGVIDFERCLAPVLRPDLGGWPVPAAKIVVLDPGHGGRDTGTSIHEKAFALDVARRAKKLLEAAGYNVALTRDEDVFVGLAQRSAFASVSRADLFVSIHFNALVNDTKTSGVEIYTFPPQGQRSTNSWSPGRKIDAEPAASPANRQDHWNTVLAHALHRRLVGDLKAMDRGKKLMHLGVLRGLACPGVLVECGFLTSETEARKIGSPGYRQQIAETLVAGIRDYDA